MTKRISFSVTVCTACVTLLAGSLAAQQSSSRPSPAPNSPIGLTVGPPSTAGDVRPYYRDPSQLNASLQENDGPRARLGRELGRLMTILSDSQNEEERRNATEAAEKTIAEYFDLDMASRRQELERVMQRAADMGEMLTRREAAKQELVELQMKSLELEASGLGLVPTVGSLAESARNRGYSAYGPVGSDLAARYEMEMMARRRSGSSEESTGNVAEETRASAGRALHAAYENHRQASATDVVAETGALLRQALSDYFDADMEVRRAELDEIRAGLEKLEHAVAKREEVRDEIIQVELQLILNQAAGLGFFDDSRWNAGESRPQYSIPPVAR